MTNQLIQILRSSYTYGDDAAIAAQGSTFEETEKTTMIVLNELGNYYENNYLKPNPSKTQTWLSI